MEFRWVALIALWTMISGPILGTQSGPPKASKAKVSKTTKQPAKAHSAR